MTKNEIKEKIKDLLLGYSHFTPSFSQAGEDMILANIFRLVQNGTYVDAGAYHPLNGSNTHYFYRFKNWTGINIEPNPNGIAAFNKIRPKDINLNLGISANSNILKYYMVDDIPVMNTFSLKFLQDAGMEKNISRVIDVQTHPLSYILDEYLAKNKSIDLLNVDVEGLDLEVLKSNNWEKYKPSAIISETGLEDIETNTTKKYLENLNYTIVGITPVNLQHNYSIIYFDKDKLKTFRNY